MVTRTSKRGKTNTEKPTVQLSCKGFGFYTNCEHRPALPFLCWANVHTASWRLRSRVFLHHLLPANRVTAESSGCLALESGVDTAGMGLDPACLHSSRGKGNFFPWFLPLTPLRALKARKVCRFVCFGVSNFTCMTV